MNKQNLNVIPEIIAANFVSHQPGGQDFRGPEGVKQFASMYQKASPDARLTVDDQFAEGDKVVTRWTARGTHRGELMGIQPTGKRVTISGITINRIAGGKIVEEWENYDQMGMMQQLGVIPAPGQARR
jgi:steroid delta-isomerase-like uncharacterized protein